MNTQYKKSILDMCVLAVLDRDDNYGYDMADYLSKTIEVEDVSVYPLLRKLAKDGRVTTYLKESQTGPPRKYYRLADEGRKVLNEYRKDWKEFTAVVNHILEGEPIE